MSHDHKSDKNELINLVDNKDYFKVMDSLKLEIKQKSLMLLLVLRTLEDNLKILNQCTRKKI